MSTFALMQVATCLCNVTALLTCSNSLFKTAC